MELLPSYEKFVGLPPGQACRLLGVAYSTYHQYRRGQREIPLYVALHMDLIMRLDQDQVDELIRERAPICEGAR